MPSSLSRRTVLFWLCSVACLSAISTMIFSETTINDSLGGLTLAISSIGLLCFGALRLLDHVLEICNP